MSVNFTDTYFMNWLKSDVTGDVAEGIMRIFFSYAC